MRKDQGSRIEEQGDEPVRCGCGGEPVVGHIEKTSYLPKDRWYIGCPKCDICTGLYDTEAEAVKAWNRAMGANPDKKGMSDLISRQKAIDALGEKPVGETDWDLGCINQWEWDREILRTLPSAEPEERTAMVWNLPKGSSIAYVGRCSCGQVFDVLQKDYKYCPSCGARLEWGKG